MKINPNEIEKLLEPDRVPIRRKTKIETGKPSKNDKRNKPKRGQRHKSLYS